MEVREVVRVVRKHWIIALVGLVVAIALGYETYANRADAKYSSNATIFVTQGDFSTSVASVTANSSALTGLAYLYSQLAQSDVIRERVGAPPKAITASVVTTGSFSTGAPLPFVYLTVLGNSPAAAMHLANATTAALQSYVASAENKAGNTAGNRVNLQVITAPAPGKAQAARTRVVLLPAVVSLTVILATLGLIFLVENMSRSRRTANETIGTDSMRSRWLPSRTREPDEALGDQAAMSKAVRQQ